MTSKESPNVIMASEDMTQSGTNSIKDESVNEMENFKIENSNNSSNGNDGENTSSNISRTDSEVDDSNDGKDDFCQSESERDSENDSENEDVDDIGDGGDIIDGDSESCASGSDADVTEDLEKSEEEQSDIDVVSNSAAKKKKKHSTTNKRKTKKKKMENETKNKNDGEITMHVEESNAKKYAIKCKWDDTISKIKGIVASGDGELMYIEIKKDKYLKNSIKCQNEQLTLRKVYFDKILLKTKYRNHILKKKKFDIKISIKEKDTSSIILTSCVFKNTYEIEKISNDTKFSTIIKNIESKYGIAPDDFIIYEKSNRRAVSRMVQIVEDDDMIGNGFSDKQFYLAVSRDIKRIIENGNHASRFNAAIIENEIKKCAKIALIVDDNCIFVDPDKNLGDELKSEGVLELDLSDTAIVKENKVKCVDVDAIVAFDNDVDVDVDVDAFFCTL